MKWECEKCIHKSVCGEWEKQESMAACSYGDYFREDILGDDFDPERIKILVNQRMTMREEVAERFSITKNIPIGRLRDLVEVDREGRCVVLPGKVGDAVYLTNWFGVTKHTIYRIIDPYFYTDCAKGFSLNDFGKIAFLTQEAAKAALGIAERGIANGQST